MKKILLLGVLFGFYQATKPKTNKTITPGNTTDNVADDDVTIKPITQIDRGSDLAPEYF